MSDFFGKSNNPSRRELAESYAAGNADSRRFMALYRAYLRGAADAAGCEDEADRQSGLKMALAGMTFALLSWALMLLFVFKS